MRFEWTHAPDSDFGPRPRLVRGLALCAWLVSTIVFMCAAIAGTDADKSGWLSLLWLSALALAGGILFFGLDDLQLEKNREYYLIDDGGIFGIRAGKIIRATFGELSGFELEAWADDVVVIRGYPWGCSCPIDRDTKLEDHLEIRLPATLDLDAFKRFMLAAFAKEHGRPHPPPRSVTDTGLIVTRVEPSDDRLKLILRDTEALVLERSEVRTIEVIPNPFRPNEPNEIVHLEDGRRLHVFRELMPKFRAWFCEKPT